MKPLILALSFTLSLTAVAADNSDDAQILPHKLYEDDGTTLSQNVGDCLNMHKEDAGKSHQILAANPITARVAGKCKVAGGRGKDMHRNAQKTGKTCAVALLICA